MEKLDKIKEITGNASVGFSQIDLEEDFDPDNYDKLMTVLMIFTKNLAYLLSTIKATLTILWTWWGMCGHSIQIKEMPHANIVQQKLWLCWNYVFFQKMFNKDYYNMEEETDAKPVFSNDEELGLEGN